MKQSNCKSWNINCENTFYKLNIPSWFGTIRPLNMSPEIRCHNERFFQVDGLKLECEDKFS